ncbi:hypothetical protein S7335_4529 [Synechococcus sp. PCC 7335]|nr:hypothetical protein S7335_4529 [Synechococcus sp. PCC 7335]
MSILEKHVDEDMGDKTMQLNLADAYSLRGLRLRAAAMRSALLWQRL